MAHKIFVHTDKGKFHSLRKQVQIVFTLTPVDSRQRTVSYDPVAWNIMKFESNVEKRLEFEWDSKFAFNTYENKYSRGKTRCSTADYHWPLSDGKSRTIVKPVGKGIDWLPEDSFDDNYNYGQPFVSVLNKTRTTQNVALKVETAGGSFANIVAYNPVEHGERLVVPSTLLLQAYAVDYAANYDRVILLRKDMVHPLFEVPIRTDALPATSNWKLCQDRSEEILLKNDDVPRLGLPLSIQTLADSLADILKSLNGAQQISAVVQSSAGTAPNQYASQYIRGDQTRPPGNTASETRTSTTSRNVSGPVQSSSTTIVDGKVIEESFTRGPLFDRSETSYQAAGPDTALRLVRLEEKANTLTTSFNKAGGDLKAVQDFVETARPQLADLKITVPSLKTQTSKLDKSFGQARNEISALQVSITRAEGALGQTHNQMVASVTDTRNLMEDVSEDLNGRLASLEDFVPQVDGRLDSLEKSFLDAQSALAFNRRMVDTGNYFDQLEETGHLETRVGDIQGELTRTREEVQTVEIKVGALEDHRILVDENILELQRSLKGTQEDVVAIEGPLKETRDGLPHIIEKPFQESETIRTTIVDSALSNELSSLGARMEKTEKTLFLIEESVNVVDVKVAKIDTSLSELRHETEQSLSLVGGSVENVNRRVDEAETSLSILRQAVTEIFKETVLHSQELREKTETTVCESEVIREAINNMVVASAVGSRLVVVENKTLDVEKTVKDTIREVLVSVVEPQISDIKIESEETNSRLAEVEGTVTNNFTQLSSKLETHVQDTERTLSLVQESVTKVDTKIETVESSSLELRGETERSLSLVGESVKKVDARVDEVEASLSELRREVPKIFKETIHTSVELQEKMETVVRDNVVIRETINNMVVASDVGSRLSVVEADIDGITKTLESDVEPRLSDLEGKEIPQLKLLVESINTHVTKLDHTTTTEITALDDARQRMLQSVTEVRTSVSELSPNLNDQIEDVRTHTERRLELVEGSVRHIDGTLSSQDEKVTIMKEELRNDIGEIAQLTANVQSELDSFIVDCSKEHDTLKSDIDKVERETQQTLARHQTSIDALDGRVTVVERSAFAGVSDLSEEMHRRLDAAARELTEVDKRTNERVDRVDERVTGVDGRVSEVNGQINKRTTMSGNR